MRSTLRTAALMAAGTFGVHQLRFALSDDHARAVYGHAYLSAVAPILGALLVLAFAGVLSRVARGEAEPAPRFRRMWVGASASLLAAYCTQESLEGLLTHGRATGMFAHGGWVAVPLAAVIGLGIALVSRGEASASELLLADATPWQGAPAAAPIDAFLPVWSPRPTSAAARHLAARGPPLAASA